MWIAYDYVQRQQQTYLYIKTSRIYWKVINAVRFGYIKAISHHFKAPKSSDMPKIIQYNETSLWVTCVRTSNFLRSLVHLR